MPPVSDMAQLSRARGDGGTRIMRGDGELWLRIWLFRGNDAVYLPSSLINPEEQIAL